MTYTWEQAQANDTELCPRDELPDYSEYETRCDLCWQEYEGAGTPYTFFSDTGHQTLQEVGGKICPQCAKIETDRTMTTTTNNNQREEKTMENTTLTVTAIEVHIDTNALFDGWSTDDIKSLDIKASVQKFLDLVAAQTRRYWPDASVEVDDASDNGDNITVTCSKPGDEDVNHLQYHQEQEETEAIRELISSIYYDGPGWQVERG